MFFLSAKATLLFLGAAIKRKKKSYLFQPFLLMIVCVKAL